LGSDKFPQQFTVFIIHSYVVVAQGAIQFMTYDLRLTTYDLNKNVISR